MKLSLRDRYGSWVLFFLLLFLAWWMLSSGLHTTYEFAYFFPINWVLIFPFGKEIIRWAVLQESELWWEALHTLLTVLGWMFVFFTVRGVYFRLRSAEGISTWVLWGMITLCFIAFTVFLLRPAFMQLDLLWEAWPEGGARGRI